MWAYIIIGGDLSGKNILCANVGDL